MEKHESRTQFFMKLPDFIKSIEYNQNLINCLGDHQYFKQFKEPLMKFSSKREKIFYILFVMTRERSTCTTLVQILRQTGQNEVADRLEILNTSSGPMELTTDIEIKINEVSAPKKDLSNSYNLLDNPRGKCIIINNLEDPQKPDGKLVKSKGLKRETQRFEYLFKKLYFEVQVLPHLNAIQMKEKLSEISEDESLKSSEALVVIVISHGHNEQVFGYNACDIFRKVRFEEISIESEESKQKTKLEALKDMIEIKEIIEMFSEKRCPQLRSKPKLYFFICCREKPNDPESSKKLKTEESELVKVAKTKTITYEPNIDTFVSYACSEGFNNFYKKKWGMSYFGQALTHSIAQYAVDEPLSGIMSRTSKRLKEMYKQYANKKHKVGSYAIELNTFAMNREVYFNPGIVENSGNAENVD